MNIINFLKTNENSRKVFGKREIKIIEKQLLGINLTQSEKNRLSRDIRQKLEFIKEVSRFSDQFKLKKGALIKKIIEEAKDVILEDILHKKISKIILFGSAVKNELSFRSDIDIAVVFSKISNKDADLFRKRVSGKVADRIDVQVFNFLPNKIKKEIINQGRIIYENK